MYCTFWNIFEARGIFRTASNIYMMDDLRSVKSVRIRSYSGPHFAIFVLNMERYGVSLNIQSKCGKMRTRITPNTDTFHAVFSLLIIEYQTLYLSLRFFWLKVWGDAISKDFNMNGFWNNYERLIMLILDKFAITDKFAKYYNFAIILFCKNVGVLF